MCCAYPVIGFILLGEGVVRLSLLMVSRRRGEKEWMLVMASTCRDHVILCGLGHLGFRIMEQLRLGGMEVVCIERNGEGRLVAEAKAMGVPVLAEDMTDDRSLLGAGVHHARTIIAATNNDVANLEVVLDARRVNPRIRVMLRPVRPAVGGQGVRGAVAGRGLLRLRPGRPGHRRPGHRRARAVGLRSSRACST